MTAPALRHAVLPDRALIRLDGPDWRSFLQGLLTQDVETMAEGETRYAALLTPQGRILFDLFVRAEGEGATLDVAKETREALLGRLKLYRLRAKVGIEAADGAVVAHWGGTGDASAPGGSADPRLPALGRRAADLPAPPGSTPATAEDYRAHRIALGVGDVIEDGLADKAYALEANLDLLNGVDFGKGCFVGQETTSRMKRRAVARTRLAPIRFDGPPPAPGSEVLAGTLRAGEVRSGVVLPGIGGVALALLRLDRAMAAELSVDGRAATLDLPDWLAPSARAARDAADGATPPVAT